MLSREYADDVRYVRHLTSLERESGQSRATTAGDSGWRPAAVRAIEERHGADKVGPWDDWGCGFVSSKLGAGR